jgi:rhodanese-related sulfurtransferase
MKTFQELITDSLKQGTQEIFPWDLSELNEEQRKRFLLLDIRESHEFDRLHIKGSINVPRGILEPSCEYGYDETMPELVNARNRDIVVICRSGNRSVLAASTMQQMGFKSVKSLKTGVRGWNDYELPLQNKQGEPVDSEEAESMLAPRLKPEQMAPKQKVA